MVRLDAQTSWHFRFHKPRSRRKRMAIGIGKPVDGRLCRFSVRLLLDPRGEQGNAILIMCEHAPPNQRGFYGSWVQIGAPAGFLLPSALFAILTATQSEETFLAWGWRIPFLLSIVLVSVGLYIRIKLTESPLFANVRKQHAEDASYVGTAGISCLGLAQRLRR